MRGVKQRIRGLAGVAAAWAGAWAPLGAVLGAWDAASLDLYSRYGLSFVLRSILEPAAASATAGALCGVLFGALLIRSKRENVGLADLRIGRIALWGALGAMLFPVGIGMATSAVLSTKLVLLTGAFAVLGGGSAAATLALARRGSPDVRARDRLCAPVR